MPTWSKIRDKLENEYLAEHLRGYIQYFVTTYRESHDQEGRAAIRYNGKEILSGAFYHKNHPVQWDFDIVDDASLKMGAFDQSSFYTAFQEFDNQSIEKSLKSTDLIVRIFAILDKRVGKRRLISMRDKISEEPETFQAFYNIRAEAEGLL